MEFKLERWIVKLPCIVSVAWDLIFHMLQAFHHCFRAVCLGRLPLICSLNLLPSWLSIAYLGSLNEVHRLDKSLRHPSKYWSRKGLSPRARYWSSTLLLEKFIIISTVLVVEKLWAKNSTKICYRTRKSPLKIMLSMILFFLKWIQVLLLKEKLLKKKKTIS